MNLSATVVALISISVLAACGNASSANQKKTGGLVIETNEATMRASCAAVGNRLPIAGSKIYQQFVDKSRKDSSVDVSQQRLEANQAVDFSQSAARWSRALMDSAHKHVAANQLAQYNQVFRDSLVRTEQAIAKDPWIAIDAWNYCGSAYGLFR